MTDEGDPELFRNAVTVGQLGFPVYDKILAERAQPTGHEVRCIFAVLCHVKADSSKYVSVARRLAYGRFTHYDKETILQFLAKYGGRDDIRLALTFLCHDKGFTAVGCLKILANYGGREEADLILAVLATLDSEWPDETRDCARNAVIRIDSRLAAEAAKLKPAPPAKQP